MAPDDRPDVALRLDGAGACKLLAEQGTEFLALSEEQLRGFAAEALADCKPLRMAKIKARYRRDVDRAQGSIDGLEAQAHVALLAADYLAGLDAENVAEALDVPLPDGAQEALEAEGEGDRG